MPTASHHPKSGFSLVEVTLSLGILAFCMIPLIGLLPTGINAQHRAAETALAANTLAMLTTAVNSSQVFSRNANGSITYRLPTYFTDDGSETHYTTATIPSEDAPTIRTYGILEDGSIHLTTDLTKVPRQTLYVQRFPPATPSRMTTAAAGTTVPCTAVRVYAIVAWPALPSDNATMAVDKLKNRQGFVETYITYVPPN